MTDGEITFISIENSSVCYSIKIVPVVLLYVGGLS